MQASEQWQSILRCDPTTLNQLAHIIKNIDYSYFVTNHTHKTQHRKQEMKQLKYNPIRKINNNKINSMKNKHVRAHSILKQKKKIK